MRYLVYITPRVSEASLGDEIDISDSVSENGIGKIRYGMSDDSDFDFGTFLYDNLSLRLKNETGLFSDPGDSRSIFLFSREQSRVRIVFENDRRQKFTLFRGVINDEGTKINPKTDDITLSVLSSDSAIRNTVIDEATIDAGITSTVAIKRLINRPPINETVIYYPDNITPPVSFNIDDADGFSNSKTQVKLAELMLATNSVLLTDVDGTIVVRNRDANVLPALYLYGPGDIYSRENCLIREFSNGLHRMFTSIKINDRVATNTTIANLYGEKQKAIDFDFVTSNSTADVIAAALLNEFQAPKKEITVEVDTRLSIGLRAFDPVRVEYPLQSRPAYPDTTLPLAGNFLAGEARFPYQTGAIKVLSNTKFKIRGIEHDPSTFRTELKLREEGTDLNDGVE